MPNPERKIYLKHETIKVGFGSTGKITRLENYFEVTEVGEDRVKLFLLDIEDQPIGQPMVIPKEKLKEYIYCPDYFQHKKKPSNLVADMHVQRGDEHFAQAKLLSAEYEYRQALKVKANHLRGNLGMGQTLFALGEKEKAREYFVKLSSLEELFDKDNKHIFNEVGIALRKRGLVQEAVANYAKAIAIDPKDWVLYYNLARAHYEIGEKAKALKQLKVALQIKPDFTEAENLLKSIESALSPKESRQKLPGEAHERAF